MMQRVPAIWKYSCLNFVNQPYLLWRIKYVWAHLYHFYSRM